MKESTTRLWGRQNQHPGDRLRLFSTLAQTFDVKSVLYPGSWVDVAPSFVFDDVTYVDLDKQAAKFFADVEGVNELIRQNRITGSPGQWRFIPQDYKTHLEVPPKSVDLLVSLYAGFVSEHCTRYLRPGGLLLVNASHGDAAMASIDPRYDFIAAITSDSGVYTVRRNHLETYLIPKKPVDVTAESLHSSGRGVAYTKRAFAYVFRLREATES